MNMSIKSIAQSPWKPLQQAWNDRNELQAKLHQTELKHTARGALLSDAKDSLLALQREQRLLQLRAKGSEIRENIGAAWAQGVSNFVKGALQLGQALTNGKLPLTVTELEQDPNAERASKKLNEQADAVGPQILSKLGKLTSYSASLQALAEQRTVASQALSAHTGVLLKALQESASSYGSAQLDASVSAVVGGVQETSRFVGEQYQDLRKRVFSSLSEFAAGVERWAEAHEAAALQPPPSPAGVLFHVPVAVRTNLARIDPRDEFKIRSPQTGREWLSLLAGLDYTQVGQLKNGRRMSSEDLDRALNPPAIKYQHRPVAEVRRGIEQLLGLPKNVSSIAVRREGDRRAALGVDRFTSKADFDLKLVDLGLPPDASAQKIADAVQLPQLLVDLKKMWETTDGKPPTVEPVAFEGISNRLDEIKERAKAELLANPSEANARALIATTQGLHRKPNQAQNATNLAIAFFENPAVKKTLKSVDEERVVEALGFIGLGELTKSTRFMASLLRPTPEDIRENAKGTPEEAARLFQALGLGDTETAALLRTHRDANPSTEAVLVDTLNQAAAMLAKPFFRKSENLPKVLETLKKEAKTVLQRNLETDYPNVWQALQSFLTAEALSSLTPELRSEHFAVRL